MENNLDQRFQELILRFHRLGGEATPIEAQGITPAQVVYLDYLSKHPGCRLTDLAEALRYKAASASVMVSTLEGKGLIRKAQELDDGRALRLSLTEGGARVVAEVEAFRGKRVERMLARLDQAEKAQLIALLEKVMIKEDED